MATMGDTPLDERLALASLLLQPDGPAACAERPFQAAMIFRPCSGVGAAKRGGCLSVFAIGAVAVGAFGCDSSFESALNPSVVSCQVTASMPAQSLAAAGGSGSFQVSALPECAWQITPGTSWITGITPDSGQGNQQVGFAVAPNPSQQARQGEVVINSVRLTIRQDAAPVPPPPPPPGPSPPPPSPSPSCTYAITPDRIEVGRNGATGRTVAVTTAASCLWTAVSNATWITVTSGSSGTGSGVVRFNVAANTGGKRNGTITIAGRTLRVDQDKD